MADSIRIGEFELMPISDGRLASDPTTSFPASEPEDWDAFREHYPEAFTEDGEWHNNLGLFCLRSGSATVIVDTGIGPGPVRFLGDVRGVLPCELDRLGVSPTEVDIVFFTHLHPDHVGWTFGDADNDGPFFANARHVVHRADWDYFTHPPTGGASETITKCVIPLQESGQLDFVDGDGKLGSGLEIFHTPGHTPGHMSLLARSSGSEVFISGDLIHHPAQVERTDWSHRADLEGTLSSHYRTRWLERIEASGALWATGHFPPPSVGTLVRQGGQRIWQPSR